MGILIIYLIGFVLSYLIGRYTVRKDIEWEYGWEEVFIVFSISLLSYLGIIAFLYLLFESFFSDKFQIKKPPKWL